MQSEEFHKLGLGKKFSLYQVSSLAELGDCDQATFHFKDCSFTLSLGIVHYATTHCTAVSLDREHLSVKLVCLFVCVSYIRRWDQLLLYSHLKLKSN